MLVQLLSLAGLMRIATAIPAPASVERSLRNGNLMELESLQPWAGTTGTPSARVEAPHRSLWRLQTLS